MMEQVATLSAINSATMTVTPALVESMLGEAAELRGKLDDMVRMFTSNNPLYTLHIRMKLLQTFRLLWGRALKNLKAPL